MKPTQQATTAIEQSKVDKPVQKGPVTIQPQQFGQISGGLPRGGGWLVVSSSTAVPTTTLA